MSTQNILEQILEQIANAGGSCGCLSCHLDSLTSGPASKALTIGEAEKMKAASSQFAQLREQVEFVINTDPEKLEVIEAFAHSEGYPASAKLVDAYAEFRLKLREIAPEYKAECSAKYEAANPTPPPAPEPAPTMPEDTGERVKGDPKSHPAVPAFLK